MCSNNGDIKDDVKVKATILRGYASSLGKVPYVPREREKNRIYRQFKEDRRNCISVARVLLLFLARDLIINDRRDYLVYRHGRRISITGNNKVATLYR